MKQIGVELVRVYVLDVDDDVDTSDWMGVGMLLADRRETPEIVDLLAWDLVGDIHSQASALNEEQARKRRVADAIAMLDTQMTVVGD